ncbi:hypothetical protein ACT7DC_01325 [Bacillus cereus]
MKHIILVDKVKLPSKDFEKLRELSFVSEMKVKYQAEKRMAAVTGKIRRFPEEKYLQGVS